MININEILRSEKLRKVTIAASIIGSLGVSACGGNNGGEEAVLGLILMGRGYQTDNAAAAAAGQGMVNYGAALAGRNQNQTNVNVNINNPNAINENRPEVVVNQTRQGVVDEIFKGRQSAKPGEFFYLTANYYRDYNGDGMIAPNEFKGIKDVFSVGEDLVIVAYERREGLKGHRLDLDVRSPSGAIVYRAEQFTIQYDIGAIDIIEKSKEIPLTTAFFNVGGAGTYTAEWKTDGVISGSSKFTIMPK